MRKAKREIKDIQEIADVVKRCDTIRLGIRGEKSPYIVPVSFGYEVTEGKIVLYIHGAKEGKKPEGLAQYPDICVEGDICHGFAENGAGGLTCEYESFIGYGQAEIVTGEEAGRGIQLLLEHCGFPDYTFHPDVFQAMNIYRIVLDQVTGKRNLLK